GLRDVVWNLPARFHHHEYRLQHRGSFYAGPRGEELLGRSCSVRDGDSPLCYPHTVEGSVLSLNHISPAYTCRGTACRKTSSHQRPSAPALPSPDSAGRHSRPTVHGAGRG